MALDTLDYITELEQERVRLRGNADQPPSSEPRLTADKESSAVENRPSIELQRDSVNAPLSDQRATSSTPHFEPFSPDEWRQVTTAVREQIARGELKLEKPPESKRTYTPHFEPLSEQEKEHLHEQIRGQIARGELQLRSDADGLPDDRIWIAASRALPEGYFLTRIEKYSEIHGRRPSIYSVDLTDCWIAYLDAAERQAAIRASTIIAIRDWDARVTYIGSANDEG